MGLSGETEKMDSITFTKTPLKKNVKYLLNNTFLKLGNKIIREIIKISIGSNVLHSLQTPFYVIMKINRLKGWKWMILGKEDLEMNPGPLMTILNAVMVKRLSKVLKRYISLNFYWKRKTQGRGRGHF